MRNSPAVWRLGSLSNMATKRLSGLALTLKAKGIKNPRILAAARKNAAQPKK